MKHLDGSLLHGRRRYPARIPWRLLRPLGAMLVSLGLLAVLDAGMVRPTRREQIRALRLAARSAGPENASRWLRLLCELRPDDRMALDEVVRSLEKEGRIADASRLLDGTKALTEGERLSRLVALHERAGYREAAYRSLSDRLPVFPPVSLDRKFRELVDRLHPDQPAFWRESLDGAFNRKIASRLFAYLLGGEEDGREEARDMLRRLATMRLDEPDLILLMDGAERAGLDSLAFRLGLTASALANERERDELVETLVRLLLRSSEELPFDGAWESPDRLIESISGKESGRPDSTSSCRGFYHLVLAERLLSYLQDRGALSPELGLAATKKRRRLGLPVDRWLPWTGGENPCTRAAALDLSLEMMGEEDDRGEERASRLSEELALLSEAEERGRPCMRSYLDALERAASWMRRGERLRPHARNVLLAEMDRHPDVEPLWERIAAWLKPFSRDLAPRFLRAAKRFGSARFASYARAAAMAPPSPSSLRAIGSLPAAGSAPKRGRASRTPSGGGEERFRDCDHRLPAPRQGRVMGNPADLLESWFVPGFEETKDALFFEESLSSVPWCRYEISRVGARTIVFPASGISEMGFLRCFRRLSARRFGPIEVDEAGFSFRFIAGGIFTVATVRTAHGFVRVRGDFLPAGP